MSSDGVLCHSQGFIAGFLDSCWRCAPVLLIFIRRAVRDRTVRDDFSKGYLAATSMAVADGRVTVCVSVVPAMVFSLHVSVRLSVDE